MDAIRGALRSGDEGSRFHASAVVRGAEKRGFNGGRDGEGGHGMSNETRLLEKRFCRRWITLQSEKRSLNYDAVRADKK